MCCGEPEASVSDDRPSVTIGEATVPLYTQVRGAEIQIGNYGLARNTTACYVPEAVAIELARDHRLGPAPLAINAAEAEPPVPVVPEEDETEQPRKRRKEK